MPSDIRINDLLHLKTIPGISDRKIIQLVNYFGSTDFLRSAEPRQLVKVPGIKETDALAIRRTPVDHSYRTLQFSALNKVNGRILTLWDDEYPEPLKNIYDPPPLLFVRGVLLPRDNYSVAIVGTRHPTPAGRANARSFAKELSERGITVVSGLARGVDTIVHRTTLAAEGRTIAVLGGSIDRIYPQENEPLVAAIEQGERGAVISELPMSTPSHPAFFPRRNRIISGTSLGTLIVESDNDGGAMITATTAIDQNRELFCLPGNITERKSFGTNRLIKSGQAKLVQTVEDIIDELRRSLRPVLKTSIPEPPPPPLSIFEQKIYDALATEPKHVDRLSEETALSVSDVLVHLLSLEFKGCARQMAGKMFVKQ